MHFVWQKSGNQNRSGVCWGLLLNMVCSYLVSHLASHKSFWFSSHSNPWQRVVVSLPNVFLVYRTTGLPCTGRVQLDMHSSPSFCWILELRWMLRMMWVSVCSHCTPVHCSVSGWELTDRVVCFTPFVGVLDSSAHCSFCRKRGNC